MTIHLQFDVQKSPAFVAHCLTDMREFARFHPLIKKIEPLEGNQYRFFERAPFRFLPYTFTYVSTVTANDNAIDMHATVMGMVHIRLQFHLTASAKGTLVSEKAHVKSILPVGFIMSSVFKNAHQKLFDNINNA